MRVLIRGAGDLASGIALRLKRSGFSVVMTDLPFPTSIRRTVAFSEAIRFGSCVIEDIRAEYAQDASSAAEIMSRGVIPVLADPECRCRDELRPDVLVDAIIAKVNLGTSINDAPVVIGVGPGFTAGADCHAVVESMRGHTLGRAIYSGSALPNTDIPGLIGGFSGERVLRAPCDGVFKGVHDIGDIVKSGEAAAYVNGEAVTCMIDGVLRGLLPDGTVVKKGMKAGDVDPRGEVSYCYSSSDKALAIGGGVLEAILHLSM